LDASPTFPAIEFLDLDHTAHRELFSGEDEVWTALARLAAYLNGLIESLAGERLAGQVDERAALGELVYVAEGAKVEAHATIKGPAWIGPGTIVRSGAYVRENVIAGEGCMMGNSSEFKNCILFDSCEVPHFNYVGDSILGHRAHLGAGVICSNVRLDRGNVRVRDKDGCPLDTGLRKFGAIVGDRTEVGCNAVLNPGSLLGRDCILYPGTNWTGHLGDRQIVKNQQSLHVSTRRGT